MSRYTPVTISVGSTQVDMVIASDTFTGVVIEANHDLDNPDVLQALCLAQRFCLPAMDAVEQIAHAQAYISRDNPGRDIKYFERVYDEDAGSLKKKIAAGLAAIDRCYTGCGVDFYDGIDKHGRWLIDFLFMTDEEDAKMIVNSALKPKDKPGYVYVLQSDSGLYKIGRTVAPHNRLKTFHVKLPFVVSYTLVIESAAHIQLERDLHQRFSDKRKGGEWFALRSSDIEALRQEYKDHVVPNL